MLVGAVEPVAEVGCGFVRCFAIERHHRRRDARNAHNMGAPAFLGHPRHFNDERAAGNNSFKAMPHDYSADKLILKSENEEQSRSYVTCGAKQAKRSTEGGL